MKNIAVLTGAGMSAESGLSTFRDNDGLWDKYSVYEVATPEAWAKNQQLVLDFYNERRKQLFEVAPNSGHLLLAQFENDFDIHVITQNIDDLHERAGSSKVLHLHGELKKAVSTKYPNDVQEINGWQLNLGDNCKKGYQLRPHVVWFGEAVPAMVEAEEIVNNCDALVVIGTSLNVYPAANLLYQIRKGTPIWVIDPGEMDLSSHKKCVHLKENATTGIEKLKSQLSKGILI